jgi:hypothetical protein
MPAMRSAMVCLDLALRLILCLRIADYPWGQLLWVTDDDER